RSRVKCSVDTTGRGTALGRLVDLPNGRAQPHPRSGPRPPGGERRARADAAARRQGGRGAPEPSHVLLSDARRSDAGGGAPFDRAAGGRPCPQAGAQSDASREGGGKITQRSANARANAGSMHTLVEAQNLLKRYREGAAFRYYVEERMPLVLLAVVVFLGYSVASTAATIVFVGGTHGFLTFL